MTTLEKVNDLRQLVNQYTTESFAGFFAYFIRRRPGDTDDIDLNKFESKLKDFLYLIGLNAFSDSHGTEKFELDTAVIARLADKLNAIKDDYRVEKWTDYTLESVIHEMAFRNHFDNGVLSYIEQDLEKIRTVFTPFDNIITQEYGFDVDFLIEVYKASEMTTKIRFGHVMEFANSREFQDVQAKIAAKEITLTEAIDLLPQKISDGWLNFMAKTHAYLLFTPEDLYPMFEKEKVDNFLKVFSCKPHPKKGFNYYTDTNPLELAPILEVGPGRYLHICQKQIPIAIYRVLYSFLLGKYLIAEKIKKHRDNSLEDKVTAIFKSFFPTTNAFFYENYYAVPGHEQDLLILYKGHAFIIETKASKLREPFRDIEKAIVRLRSDFKDSIQAGYDQCKRVEDCFAKGQKFPVSDERGNVQYVIDPNKYHSVFSIIVTLERFGSLQTDLNLLLSKEDTAENPWSVYIDDLETFLLSLKTTTREPQTKFTQFLKLRRLLHGKSYAIDELDVCGAYIKDPEKFNKDVQKKEGFIYYMPDQQAIFDDLYYQGGLPFKEKVAIELSRYFGNSESSAD